MTCLQVKVGNSGESSNGLMFSVLCKPLAAIGEQEQLGRDCEIESYGVREELSVDDVPDE